MAGERPQADSEGPNARGAGGLRVLQLTDSHLFADTEATLGGVPTLPSYNQVLEAVITQHWPLDAILFTGDLVHDGSLSAYRRIKRDFEELGVPTLVVPGNHDSPATMRRVFAGGRVTWSRHAVLGTWQFIMLDSALPDSAGGKLGTPQLQALERTLTEHVQHHVVVCLHHHPVDVGSRWIDAIGLADRDALLALVERFPQVRALLWGHVHQAYSEERSGIKLLGCPSTAVQFLPGSDDFALDARPAGFRVLALHPDGDIDTRVQRLPAAAPGLDLHCESYV